MLASHRLLTFLVTSNAPNEDEHTKSLKDQAVEELKDIKHGRVSLILRDGTVHPTYPGPSDGFRYAKQSPDLLKRFFTQLNKPFYDMEHLTDEECPESEPFVDKHYDKDC